MLSKKIYYLDIKELQIYAKDTCFINDEEEFTTVVNFYHDLGIIIKHYSTVILSAKWLINLFRKLITIPHYEKMVINGNLMVNVPLHGLSYFKYIGPSL